MHIQPNKEVTVKYLSTIHELAGIRAQWGRLLAASAVQSAFLSWEWVYSWWRVNGKGKQLKVVTAWRSDELAAIAPLMLEMRNGILKVLTNIGTPQSDVGGFVHRPDDIEAVDRLIEQLVYDRSGWHILELNEFERSWLDEKGFTKRFRDVGLAAVEEDNNHYYIRLEDDWEKFSAKLARKFRYNLRRALRLAEEAGPVELQRYSGDALTWDAFKSILKINQHAHFPRLYNSKDEQELIRGLIENMASSSYSFIAYILSVNHQPVAYEYGFGDRDRFEDWRSGFDTRFSPQVSIGKLLAMKVVQECISQHNTEIDFLRGDEAYKEEWAPEVRIYTRVRIFNRSIPALAAQYWLLRLKPIVKKGPG